MKIIVLHGDNTLESYNRLQKFQEIARKRDWEIVRLSEITQNLQEALLFRGLFQKERLVVIENINLINKSTLEWLNKTSGGLNANIILYHSNFLSKTFLKSLPKVERIEEYKLPKLIWKLLDSFYPGNARLSLHLLHEATKKNPIEFVFVILSRYVRDLYWVKTDSSTMSYPSWRIAKLKMQASKFTRHQLINLISEFASADVKSKTSQERLSDLLDFIIATKLE